MRKVAVSGGFDPVHVGHLRMFEEAKALGDYLVVILNGDSWLRRKKGFVFMPAVQRAAIIGALKPVDEVFIYDSADDDVCGAISKLAPDVFANGGDRKADNTPEVELCDNLGIELAFNVGGGKVESSSALVENAKPKDLRPWGEMTMLKKTEKEWIKEISIFPGKRNSLQAHADRDELWLVLEGPVIAFVNGEQKLLQQDDTLFVRRGDVHRFMCPPHEVTPSRLIEVGRGRVSEGDIIRYEDDFGRI